MTKNGVRRKHQSKGNDDKKTTIVTAQKDWHLLKNHVGLTPGSLKGHDELNIQWRWQWFLLVIPHSTVVNGYIAVFIRIDQLICMHCFEVDHIFNP